VIYVNTEDGVSAWGYGLGVRQMLSTQFGVGVEATGDLGDAHEHEIMLGGYYAPIHDLTFKVGIGWGLTKESPDVVARVGLAWRF
jgi:hypothetical protein